MPKHLEAHYERLDTVDSPTQPLGKGSMSRSQNSFGYRMTIAGVAFIALMTLIPDPGGAGEAAATPLYCVVCGSLGGVDVLLNVLLFVPFGVGLGLAGFSWKRALLLAGILSFGIELLQMKVIPGRDASLGDILMNSAGGTIGALAGAHWRRLLAPPPREARRLALLFGMALLCTWMVTAWSLAPRLPVSAPWYGQWAPDLGNYQPFLGKVLRVSAGGEPLLPGKAIDQDKTKDLVAASPSMAFRAVLGPRPSRLAPVGAIYDEWQRQVMLLGQDRQDLAFRVSLKASGLKLRVPTVNLKAGMAGVPGDTVEAFGALHDGSFELTSRIGGIVRTRHLPLSASWGWILVMPSDSVLGEEARGLTALWIIGLLGLVSHYGALGGKAGLAVAPTAAVLLLTAVPAAAGFPAAHWSEWVAAAMGILLGMVTAMATRESWPAEADEPK